MKRVVVSVTNDLVIDQRVRKVCDTLIDEGFEILLIGRKLKKSLALKRSYPTYRMSLFFTKGFAFYAEYSIRLFIKLLFVRKDILLANDLDTLLPNFLISKLFKKKLVYDSHELFTEVPELICRPKVQKVWLGIEQFIFPKLKNVYTVSGRIVNYYHKKYKVPVSLIRNFPSRKEKSSLGSFSFEIDDKKVVLYQGAINKGRGIELVIDTMLLLPNWLFVIIGSGDIKTTLIERVQLLGITNQVYFIDNLLPLELEQLTPLADVGVSVEEDLGLNYRYALPNKLFDYMLAQIPVLVADLPEMKQIVTDYKIGMILKDRTPESVAELLTSIIDKNKNKWNFERAIKDLNWENESKKLREIYRDLR